MRELRYRVIADDLRRRVENGEFAAGRLLPSEATLSADYDASRITVRRALELLREEGLIDARQGFGWFAATDPFRQALARLGTVEAQLAASGVRSERRVLDFGFLAAPARAVEVLGVREVLEVRRVNYTLGPGGRRPFARITVWVPAELGAGLSRDDIERSPIYELIDVRLGGATQTIGAGLASPEDADVLEIPPGSPVLVCERITRSVEGRPVLLSVHVFPARLTEFVVDLPQAEPSIAPSGLRLVSDAGG